jgi:hypothetical protein
MAAGVSGNKYQSLVFMHVVGVQLCCEQWFPANNAEYERSSAPAADIFRPDLAVSAQRSNVHVACA